MTRLRRILDGDGDADEQALLASARSDGPTPGARERVLVGLGVASATATAAGAAHAAASASIPPAGAAAPAAAGGSGFGVAVLVKWVGLAALGGLLAAAVLVGRPAPVNGGGAPAAQPAAIAPARPQAATQVPTQVEPVAVPLSAPVVPPAHRAARTAPAAPPADLGAEIASLDVARKALAAGDGPKALAALNLHKKRFAGGTLAPEAQVLQVEALADSGDRTAALAAARSFLSQSSSSPHAPRVRALIARLDRAQ